MLADADKGTFESDVFSVGCLAWLLLTDRPPAATLAEREAVLNAVPDGEGGLRPSAVRPDLAVLDEAIAFATRPNRHSRPDDVAGWFDGWVLDPLTRPPAVPTVDPHEVQKGDALPGGLKVERRLDKGGTALVLHVRRKGRDYALKVPHDQGCGERLLAEARVLGKLRHEHIVALEEVVTFADLPCLLLDFAGAQTLGDLLREQGTLPLDVARRYGDDLLSAVQYLEEQGITHRDIKPANLGFTTLSKKQPHLVLLDFSLAASDPSAVTAGTAEWRDPWLYLRGAWDSVADRWSAAAVLYHALTGVRPQVEERGPHAGEARIDAERLDAAVRDRLATFFQRSLARDPAARFASAEEMRHAWAEAFTSRQETAEDVPAALDLADVRPETPVEALPLSARARNALDRAGVPTVGDLLMLPRNHISVIRGVGTKVAKEIVALAEQLRQRLPVSAGPAFVADFVRPRMALDDVDAGIDPGTRDALLGSGITTTVDAAQAPATRIGRLIGDAAADALRVRLEALAAAEPAPGSLADWARSLIGRKTEARQRLRVLVGLDPLPDGRPDEGLPSARSAAEVAATFGIDPAQVHSSLQFLRSKRWADSDVMRALLQTLCALLEAHSPAVPLVELGSALAAERAGEAASNEDRQLAAALVRVALEMRPDPPAAWRRIGKIPWVAQDPAVLDALVALAVTADRLAATEPLSSSETVRAALAEAVAETPLADMPPDRRVALAARASAGAAASARLELYPRGMDPGRALGLSLAALSGTGLTPDVVRKRVAARYPEAAPLPERPTLDALLAAHGLVFMPSVGAAGGEYVRPGQHAASTSMTVQIPSPFPATQPGFPSRRSPEAQRAAAFQDQLDRGVASRRFRVIQVRADLATPATDALSRALGIPAVSIDQVLTDAIRTRGAQREVEWSSVQAADRAGAQGPNWPLLLQLVREAADGLVDQLLSERDRPLLLVWPGGLARYRLSTALARIVDHAERGDGPAVLLVVPCYADGLPPSINGRLPVPAPLPGQRLVMPDAWLANAHRAGETA